MFEQMLLPTGGTHQVRSAALALVGQIVVVAIAALAIPAVFVAQLPKPESVTTLIAPPLPPPPPIAAARTPAARTAVTPSKVTPRVVAPRVFKPQLVAPQTIPQQLPMVAEAPPVSESDVANGIIGGVEGGVPGGVLGGSLAGVIAAPPVPKPQPAPPAPPKTLAQIRVGGEVQAARLLQEVRPSYPLLAKDARIDGTVKLSATIAPDGTVKDLHVLSGHPLLVNAALNAVKQWKYKPTYLNGKPVEVLTEVDVQFTLG